MTRPDRIVSRIVVVAALAWLGGCSLIRFDPVISEERDVTPVTDAARTITFHEPRVWLDGPVYRATQGVRDPVGTYVLEAEDADYLYFHASEPIQIRRIENGQTLNGPDQAGGLALHKIPVGWAAATYVDLVPGKKLLIWRHGFELIEMRGRVWDKSF